MPAIDRWEAEQCPFAIDYSAELLDRLRARAVEASLSIPNGGIEIGGILFGRVLPNARSPLRIEIMAERPIKCAHASGPSFRLSEQEVLDVQTSLERKRLDPEIAPFSVLGFWASHTRAALGLNDPDVELYGKLFPQSWQIVLILAPKVDGPAMASFFFRSGGVAREPAAVFAIGESEPSVATETPPRRTSFVSLPLALLLAAAFVLGLGAGYVLFHR